MLAASLASIDIIRVEAGKTGLRYSSDITTLNKGDVVEFHFGTHAQCCRRRPQEALHPSCERVASAGFYADTSPAGNDVSGCETKAIPALKPLTAKTKTHILFLM
ncbi:hypothetical protein J3459_010763 [Metarhizium acridum]|uniref:uncharacterized protein n=1 Tax=Metarhizium acridum TaxID=92637 RepID=UPI001C6CB657|nr:hypothetical protein J3458_019889 [Metarhizium acridum]KAG8422046.1 hypothetical protein J3459_010763 [Metarhizium acridum]